ncbi:MAG: hypothetical protein ABTQ25_14240 [Nitrosomonas ureae]
MKYYDSRDGFEDPEHNILQHTPIALETIIKQTDDARESVANQMPDTPLYLQGDMPDCLLQCARMAEHRQVGIDPGLEVFKNMAIENGFYSSQWGVELRGFMEIIKDRPNIVAQLDYANGPQDLKTVLDQGASVIAGVETHEYYHGLLNIEPNHGGHAVVVTHVNESKDGFWQFIVNDPNESIPNQEIDCCAFQKAWDVMNRMMITVRAKGDDS